MVIFNGMKGARSDSELAAVRILDATNTTLERRRKVKEKVCSRPGIRLIFLESLCDDEDLPSHFQS